MDEAIRVPRASAQIRVQRQEGPDQSGSRGP